MSLLINNPYGEYWFFVDDSSCPDDIINELAEYFSAKLLPLPAQGAEWLGPKLGEHCASSFGC